MGKAIPDGLPLLWAKGVGPIGYDKQNREVYASCAITDERVRSIKKEVEKYESVRLDLLEDL